MDVRQNLLFQHQVKHTHLLDSRSLLTWPYTILNYMLLYPGLLADIWLECFSTIEISRGGVTLLATPEVMSVCMHLLTIRANLITFRTNTSNCIIAQVISLATPAWSENLKGVKWEPRGWPKSQTESCIADLKAVRPVQLTSCLRLHPSWPKPWHKPWSCTYAAES